MAIYKLKSKVILHREDGLQLECLELQVGDCDCKIYREIKWTQSSIELKEWAMPPQWWNRHIKISELLSYTKDYYKKNKEKMDTYAKEYKQKNKDKWNEYQREYKKRKLREQKGVVRDYNRSVPRDDADKN
jgi:hypothetical protein